MRLSCLDYDLTPNRYHVEPMHILYLVHPPIYVLVMLDIVNSDREIVNMTAAQCYMIMCELRDMVKDHGKDAAKHLVDAWISEMANHSGSKDLDDELVRQCYKFIEKVDDDKRQGKDLEMLYPNWNEVSEESKMWMFSQGGDKEDHASLIMWYLKLCYLKNGIDVAKEKAKKIATVGAREGATAIGLDTLMDYIETLHKMVEKGLTINEHFPSIEEICTGTEQIDIKNTMDKNKV